MEWWKRKTRDYHQKLNVRVASRTANSLTNLGLTTLRNEEVLRLFTRFELVTRGFELVTRGFELALLNFNLCFKLSTRAFKLSTHNS